MIRTTKAQRRALKRVFDRGPLYSAPYVGSCVPRPQMTYREFRKSVGRTWGGDALTVPWHGIWLCIERDGHVHS